jgi:hypothetical protein
LMASMTTTTSSSAPRTTRADSGLSANAMTKVYAAAAIAGWLV